MKVSIYFDIYTWSTPENIHPTTKPSESKLNGATRYRVDVDIPDPAKPDEIISGKIDEVIDPHHV